MSERWGCIKCDQASLTDVERVERPLNAEGRYTSRLSETGALVIEEGRHAALADAERDAIDNPMRGVAASLCGPEPVYDAVEHIVAARVAEAVDRERAAWAAKIVRAMEAADPTIYGDLATPHRVLRGLLAADDTGGKP